MGKKIVKLNNTSIKVAIFVFALVLIGFALASFGFAEISEQNFNIMAVAAAVIIFGELGLVKAAMKGKAPKTDLFGILGLVAGLVIVVSLAFNLLGWGLGFLGTIQGLAFLVVGISFLIETFYR